MSRVEILCGLPGTERTAVLSRYTAVLESLRRQRSPGAALWLTPTRRAQREIVARLLASSPAACVAPGVMTFDSFAETILQASAQPASPISPVMKRTMLRHLIRRLAEQGRLPHFRGVAESSGFLDLVTSFISELKREEIWPDDFTTALQGDRPRERDLALIYREYQDALSQRQWYDSEGRFWLARTELENGRFGPFADLQQLVIAGFTDFTHTQYEIIEYLTGRCPETLITLPLDRSADRSELFAKPAAALWRLQEQLCERDVQVTNGPEIDSRPAGLATVRRGLFSNPRHWKPAADAQGLELVSVTGPDSEWTAVALRIKLLLAKGVAPGQIVVGLRNVAAEGPRWMEALQTAGLPVWCEAERPLSASPAVKALFCVLQLEIEHWPFQRVLDLLHSEFLGWPARGEVRTQLARRVGRALRHHRLHAGRDVMLRVLQRVAERLVDDRNQGELADARAAFDILSGLSQRLEPLRRSHSLDRWADVLAETLDQLAFFPPAENADPAIAREASLARQDWDLVQRILRNAAEAERELEPEPRKTTLKDFLVEFRDLLSRETIGGRAEPTGVVRILDVDQVRHLDVPHLFLAGLTESTFPASRVDDCLLSDSDRTRLNESGLRLHQRSAHQQDEMFLFFETVACPTQQLTLSYPAVSSRGQPVFPSPYATALRTLFAPGVLDEAHEGRLDPTPTRIDALSPDELRLLGVVEARAGDPGLLRWWADEPARQPTARNLLAAANVAAQRFQTQGFTPWDGRLSLPQNIQGLQGRFAASHQFSATELESYAECPFRFWLESVLDVAELPLPEEGTDHLGRGVMIHDVLARLLRENGMRLGDDLARQFVEYVEERLGRRIPETELQQALQRIEHLLMEEWAVAFAQQNSEYLEHVKASWEQLAEPLPPELAFGKLPREQDDPAAARQPLVLGQGAQQTVVWGRIDRVDRGRAGDKDVFTVIDYKTGKRPSLKLDDLESGRGLQLPLYLLAVKRLGLAGPDAVPFQMGYWALKETGFSPGLRNRAKFGSLEQAVLDQLEATLDVVVPRLAEGIRSGRFVVENADEQCTGHCAYRTVCRVNQIRPLADLLGKRSRLPAAAAPVDAESPE